MREVQIVRWCDGDHAEPEPATVERVVALDGDPPIVLDLCAKHDELFIELIDLLEFGSPVPTTPNQQGRRTRGEGLNTICPICGHNAKNRSALGTHMRDRHKTGLKASGA